MPNKHFSPKLDLKITPEAIDLAVRSNSGACVIADSIKRQYPNMTNVVVDMATIRFSDRKRGVRYTYLTPENAQHILLAFDQGWPNPFNQVEIKRAVVITPIVRAKAGVDSPTATAVRRDQKRQMLEAKVASGQTLTTGEKIALTTVSKPYKPPQRPSTVGKTNVKVPSPGRGKPVRAGGKPIVQGPAHPSLLRARDRHFGAKMSDPGTAFREAVDAAVAERLATIPINSALAVELGNVLDHRTVDEAVQEIKAPKPAKTKSATPVSKPKPKATTPTKSKRATKTTKA